MLLLNETNWGVCLFTRSRTGFATKFSEYYPRTGTCRFGWEPRRGARERGSNRDHAFCFLFCFFWTWENIHWCRTNRHGGRDVECTLIKDTTMLLFRARIHERLFRDLGIENSLCDFWPNSNLVLFLFVTLKWMCAGIKIN